ncbi:MAG: type VII secretion protein EccCa, partial [Propionibacterium sp.]|nr:type VII secretion protein EccCa [Propionibacterium sp.]
MSLVGVITFNRPKRAQPPPHPRGDLLLESPPEVPPPVTGRNFGAILRMLPMVAGAGAMAMMMMSGAGGGNVLRGVMGGMYGISMLGMMLSQTGRGNDDQAQQLDGARRDYFRYLGQTRKKVRATAEAQRKATLWRHPAPQDLWSLAGHRRMWERRTDADDFASVRISVGPQQFAQRITPPESKPIEDLEPLTTGALRRFMRTHRTVPGVPLALSLKGFNYVQLVGDVEAERRLAYAMVAQSVAWHAPTDLAVVVCAAPDVADAWQWVKWLPHLQHPSRTDGVGATRMFATDATQLSQVTEGLTSQLDHVPSQIVVVVDGAPGVSADSLATPGTHVTTIEVTRLRERPKRIEAGVAVLDVHPENLTLHRRQQSVQVASTPLGKPDQLPMVMAEMLARGLAPYRMPTTAVAEDDDSDGEEVVFEPPKDYPAQVGVGDPLTIDVRQAWKLRPVHQRLRVPIGNGEDGRPVELDIKEAALGGWGPHGLCIGATGSGKSEFLRTHVLGLAMSHPPDQLNFVLVDFKGGATFLGLDELPHVSAVITNLEGELTLVDRMQDAIEGEMARRQEVLASSGNFKNREDYDEARREGADLPPMPSLFIVVDEFSEMLTARPEFLDTFMMIGRVGRSLGVHQMLATQRLEESKLRGLDTYLSYRIGLRTFSPAESRIVLGVPDAYELPSAPGNGYLKYEQSMVRFKAAYVSGPWRGSSQESSGPSGYGEPGALMSSDAWVPPVLEFVPEYVAPVEPPEPEPEPISVEPVVEREPEPEPADEEQEEETLLDIVVDRLRGKGWPAHQVWLPPLDDPPTMDQLIGGELQVIEGRGLTVANPRAHGSLQAPVALVDRPRQQRRDPMWVDVSGAGGNVAIVGGPQSGKSMGVRAFIAGMA